MTKDEAQIRYWGDKFFPHLLPALRYALVMELVRLEIANRQSPIANLP